VSNEPDVDLVAAARRGDRSALDALLRRHHDRIYALCRRIAGNDSDALDATQEALLAICRGLDRFDGRSAFSTWMYRVTTNACLDELRRKSRRPTPVEDVSAFERTASTSLGDGVADRYDIDAALATLPEEFRAAVVLRDLCDLDYAEIASVLDIPPGTVRSRIARGRAALAQLLGNRSGPDERQNIRP
jgi:RNA polymerase sigma-70 factor (ECF subfamily)